MHSLRGRYGGAPKQSGSWLYNGTVGSIFDVHTDRFTLVNVIVCVVRVVASGVALDLCDCCTCKVRVTSTVQILSILKRQHRRTQVYVRLESKSTVRLKFMDTLVFCEVSLFCLFWGCIG